VERIVIICIIIIYFYVVWSFFVLRMNIVVFFPISFFSFVSVFFLVRSSLNVYVGWDGCVVEEL